MRACWTVLVVSFRYVIDEEGSVHVEHWIDPPDGSLSSSESGGVDIREHACCNRSGSRGARCS